MRVVYEGITPNVSGYNVAFHLEEPSSDSERPAPHILLREVRFVPNQPGGSRPTPAQIRAAVIARAQEWRASAPPVIPPPPDHDLP